MSNRYFCLLKIVDIIFIISYNNVGLIEERPYNISVRGINQFDGHKTWAGPIRPTANRKLMYTC